MASWPAAGAPSAWGSPAAPAPCSLRKVMEEEKQREAEESRRKLPDLAANSGPNNWTAKVGGPSHPAYRFTNTAARTSTKPERSPEASSSPVATSTKPWSINDARRPSPGCASSTQTTVLNIRQCNLSPLGYASLQEWVSHPDHVYIGRNMTYYVPGAVGSKWRNPFSAEKFGREECVRKYKDYIKSDIRQQENGKTLFQSLDELRGKKLGCWCHPEACHGHVLVELLNEDISPVTYTSVK